MPQINIPRNLTAKIREQLDEDEVVLIIGARQSGKTTILRQIEKVIKAQNNLSYFLSLEDPEYLASLNDSPKNLFKIFSFDLNRRSFVLMDEVQYLKDPTGFLKYFFDTYRGKIKIIATGSSAFYLDRKFKDSLVGRKKIFTLDTLSFREFLIFKDEPKLATLDFEKVALSEKEKIIFYYSEYLVYGGYPKVVLAPLTDKEEILKDIAYSYIKKDVFEANIQQEETFFKLLRILAGQVGGLVNTTELASTLDVSRTTVEDYLLVMQKSFHIALSLPFYKNIRKEVTKMRKVYFLDLGLRNFLLKDLQQFAGRRDGDQLLENAVYKELLKTHKPEDIQFWRTTQKQEVDFVASGKLAFEVKVNPKTFKKNNLRAFSVAYPQVKFSLVSFDCKETNIAGLPIKEVWLI